MSPLHLQVPHVVVSSGASLDPASNGAATLPALFGPIFDMRRSAWINKSTMKTTGLIEANSSRTPRRGTDLSRWRLVLYNGESGQALTPFICRCDFRGRMRLRGIGILHAGITEWRRLGVYQGDGIAWRWIPGTRSCNSKLRREFHRHGG